MFMIGYKNVIAALKWETVQDGWAALLQQIFEVTPSRAPAATA